MADAPSVDRVEYQLMAPGESDPRDCLEDRAYAIELADARGWRVDAVTYYVPAREVVHPVADVG